MKNKNKETRILVIYLKEMDLDHPDIPKTWKEKLL